MQEVMQKFRGQVLPLRLDIPQRDGMYIFHWCSSYICRAFTQFSKVLVPKKDDKALYNISVGGFLARILGGVFLQGLCLKGYMRNW